MSKTENKIRVAIIEDDQKSVEKASRLITELGCLVVAIATSMTQALDEVIPQLEALGVTHVLLDGNLSPRDSYGQDGRTLSEKIRAVAPDIKIVGFSLMKQDYVDVHLGKRYLNLTKENVQRVFGLT